LDFTFHTQQSLAKLYLHCFNVLIVFESPKLCTVCDNWRNHVIEQEQSFFRKQPYTYSNIYRECAELSLPRKPGSMWLCPMMENYINIDQCSYRMVHFQFVYLYKTISRSFVLTTSFEDHYFGFTYVSRHAIFITDLIKHINLFFAVSPVYAGMDASQSIRTKLCHGASTCY
jgi:hypothetical protein